MNADVVWAAILADESFVQQIPTGAPRDIFRRELVDQLPKILDTLIDQPVSLKTLIDAKVAVVRHMVEAGVMKRLIVAYPNELLTEMGVTTNDLIEMIDTALPMLLEQLEGMAEAIPRMLKALRMTEEQALMHPKVGNMNPESKALLNAGQLTIGKFLEIQPMVILKNTE